MEFLINLINETAGNIATTAKSLVIPALVFLIIAIVFKRDTWLADIRRAIPETGLNLKLMVFNLVVSMPLIGLFMTFLGGIVVASGFQLVSPATWGKLPMPLLFIVALVIIDFVAYWRHRLEHTPLLWPSHAVHHSDTEMTWLTNYRSHPINDATKALASTFVLLVIGLPIQAIMFASIIRHYYSSYLHADLPWTYGRWGKVFVSPAMHRWHHSVKAEAHDKNYAAIFSLFDRLFGTYYLPGPHEGKLGVTDDIAPTFWGQIKFAFERRAYARFMRSIGYPPKSKESVTAQQR